MTQLLLMKLGLHKTSENDRKLIFTSIMLRIYIYFVQIIFIKSNNIVFSTRELKLFNETKKINEN